MKPVSPVVPGALLPEVVYGARQPEYLGLPAIVSEDGTACSRWRLSWWERIMVLFTGNVYVWQKTFNSPLQPLLLEVERPQVGK